MPDALALLNVNDTRHLKHLAWAVYDGALLVDGWPELPGNCPWCTVLAGLYKHIYRGHEDVAHCPPHMLASWDCQERIEVLHRGGRLSSTWGGQRRASRPRRRSRSSSRCHSQTPAQGDRNGCSHSSSPCTPLKCHCGANPTHASPPHSLVGGWQPWRTGRWKDGSLQGKPQMVTGLPGGYW